MQATEKVRDSTFGSWSTSEIGLTIEYPLEVMEEIRAAVCDGLRRLAHGGLEVGGVLFGVRRDTSIRLLTWRPIFCEHALGPSFRLSPRDCAELVHLLEVDPERSVPVKQEQNRRVLLQGKKLNRTPQEKYRARSGGQISRISEKTATLRPRCYA
jgi:hypothetical protein